MKNFADKVKQTTPQTPKNVADKKNKLETHKKQGVQRVRIRRK